MKLTFRPLDASTWPDLERLFGERGACGGCWCMVWRLSAKEFEKNKGAANRAALRNMAKRGLPLGVLAYDGSSAVGWCAVAPREAYPRLEKSRVLKRVDDRPVWSVTCLFLAKPYRRRGISSELLRAAARYAASLGATIVEGYPTAPGQKLPDAFVWTGTLVSFQRAGFRECARRSPARPIVRLEVGAG